MPNLVKVVLVVLLALCVHRALRIYTLLQGCVGCHKHHPGPCKQVEGIKFGSEDFKTLSSGQTFITSGLRYNQMSSKCQEHFNHHKVKGRIYLMNLRNLTAGVQELKISSTSSFQADNFVPHGLSVWEDKRTGRHVLFVVNHPFIGSQGDRVEKFIYEPSRQELVHQTYFSHKSMTVVNDVLAVGENSFYFTNCNYFRQALGIMLETLLELPLSNLVYCDGDSYTVVDHGLKGANGVDMSPDGQHIYVAEMIPEKVHVYKRNANNTLTRMQEYPVYTWPDNIQVDQKTGHLYVGCHPVPYVFFAYVDDIGTKKAPSQVLHLHVENSVITSSEEVLYDHGELISASASALVFDNSTLLVGSVFDRLVTCQVPFAGTS